MINLKIINFEPLNDLIVGLFTHVSMTNKASKKA